MTIHDGLSIIFKFRPHFCNNSELLSQNRTFSLLGRRIVDKDLSLCLAITTLPRTPGPCRRSPRRRHHWYHHSLQLLQEILPSYRVFGTKLKAVHTASGSLDSSQSPPITVPNYEGALLKFKKLRFRVTPLPPLAFPQKLKGRLKICNI